MKTGAYKDVLEKYRTVEYMTEKAHSNLINVYEKVEIKMMDY